MGYLMGCNDPKGLADEAKYLPLIIKCNEAGWAPITHARTTPGVVGIERWGGQEPGAPLLFTVMNRSTEPVNATVTLDLAALQRAGGRRVAGLLDGTAIQSELRGQQLVVRFPLGAEKTNVFELRE